jgi:hypothetical protein
MKEDNANDVSHVIAVLVEMHEDLMAHVFAMQTFLQELGFLEPDAVDRRADEFRKGFAASRMRQLKRLSKKLSAEQRRRLRKILDKYEGPVQ